MTLNASGPISLAGATAGQSIAVELGQSATGTISLNDTAVRNLAGVPSGAIIMPTNFYGKSNISYWSSQISLSGASTDTTPTGIAFDSSNNIYLTGIYDSTTSYVIKLNSDGVIQFANRYSDASGYYAISDICVDSSSNIYITGRITVISYATVVTKLNSSGVVQWTTSIGPNLAPTNDITVDSSNNVYILARTANNADTIYKYNSSGTLLAQRQITNIDNFGSGRIAVDSSGNIYYAVAGRYTPSRAYSDIFQLKMNSSFSILSTGWIYDSSDSVDILGEIGNIVVDSSGTSYVSYTPYLPSNGRYFTEGLACNTTTNPYTLTRYYNSYFIATSPYSGTLYGQGSSQGGAAGFLDSSGNYYLGGCNNTFNAFAYQGLGIAKFTTSALSFLKYLYKTGGGLSASPSSRANASFIDSNGTLYITGLFGDWGSQKLTILKVPNDGTKTGNYTYPTSGFAVTYNNNINYPTYFGSGVGTSGYSVTTNTATVSNPSFASYSSTITSTAMTTTNDKFTM